MSFNLESGKITAMIKVGEKIPEFKNLTAYQAGKFVKLNLDDYKGQWLVLFFYPRDFTFICPTEIREFAKLEGEFEKEGAKIVGASTDSEYSHKAWFEKDLAEVKYPIIADTNQKLAGGFSCLIWDRGEALRATYIIDPDQVLRWLMISDNAVGRSVKEILRTLKALQTGELCPVEWQPGESTLGK